MPRMITLRLHYFLCKLLITKYKSKYSPELFRRVFDLDETIFRYHVNKFAQLRFNFSKKRCPLMEN